MLKKVTAAQLRVGMYIHDLSTDWLNHPFLRNRFQISSENEIRKIVAARIGEVVIDTGKGLDVAAATVPAATVEQAAVQIASAAVPVVHVAGGVDMGRAHLVRRRAAQAP